MSKAFGMEELLFTRRKYKLVSAITTRHFYVNEVHDESRTDICFEKLTIVWTCAQLPVNEQQDQIGSAYLFR